MSDEPAFPCEVNFYSNGNETQISGRQTGNYTGIATGLTKREYFAAMAMASYQGAEIDSKQLARMCVADADALLAELAKARAE